ncbi:hypothetical protein [Streptomyces sp. NPDC029004]|uniref:hypothetical protein n=1 Tax=Streptomyces sp. NPDC029004 TaxID=3154490 RepID=UPI0033F69DD1
MFGMCRKRRTRRSVMSLAITLGVCTAALVPGTASAAPRSEVSATSAMTTASRIGPFTEPAFAATCDWHRFGEGEIPPWWLMFRDPLCVEYSKRDITFDNGGALRFLVAEPSRFALAMVTCRYYQKDHWSVQTTTGATPWVTWDGQYWWDKTRQRAGAHLTNFRIHGASVGIGDAVAALRTAFPELADVLSDYGKDAGETGLTVTLPYDLRCSLAG